MNRAALLNELGRDGPPWDVLVIGGGATGLGTAVDAASRGYRTLVVDTHDFAKGTSSRSTKLVHGGVRYLRQGNVSLVREALRERGLLCQNAAHLVHHMPFVVPLYSWFDAPMYGLGFKLYDQLAGSLGLQPSRLISREETLRLLPTANPDGLRFGLVYYDAQFDDARLAVALARTVLDLGGLALNYCGVSRLLKNSQGKVSGAVLKDAETGAEYDVRAKAVVNATGVFCDSVRRMDEPAVASVVVPSQGSHLVVPRHFLPGDASLLIPHTKDARVLFAVPWHGRLILGTTDVAVPSPEWEPRPQDQEVDFILQTAAQYFTTAPTRADVLNQFSGLRPLARPQDTRSTAAVSRDHHILVSQSGLITVIGGKWTTYRRMGEDAVDLAQRVAGLPKRPCATTALHVHGAPDTPPEPAPQALWSVYGTDAEALRLLAASDPDLQAPLHPSLPFLKAEVLWAARHELARTVEDVLARRTRALIFDARSSIACAPIVARLLARELGHDERWEMSQVRAYLDVATRHLPDTPPPG